ncbi:hypothetical protein V2G26_009808 [Clonostachys chloroleuca]
MIADTSSIAGYTIFREEPNDAAPDLSKQPLAHPLDQLSIEELRVAAKTIRDHAAPKAVKFNCLTLREPKKADYAAFRNGSGPRPDRRAFAIILELGSANVAEVVVNLKQSIVESWNPVSEVAPTLTLEDLDVCEQVALKDPRVIQACSDIGITDMSLVFIDAWAVGFDHRWGMERRLQQGIVYFRNSRFDNQYAHPLDFSVVVDTEKEEVLTVDIRLVNGERTKPSFLEHNYMPEFIGDGYNDQLLKPIDITQPEGVSFQMDGNEISWAGYKMHIGFNYREGIVLSDVRVHDHHEQRERTLFNRISVVEMVVPYGNPDTPHHRKHAFDVGEYGTGLMTNSLKLGCDCKGVIHYMDAIMATRSGEPAIIENAICIHEEDNGLLYKHTDYRDGTVISARDRKLIISQIITAANYEYAFYHTFTLDGTYKLEMKLTGMLNTYCMHPSESASPSAPRLPQPSTPTTTSTSSLCASTPRSTAPTTPSCRATPCLRRPPWAPLRTCMATASTARRRRSAPPRRPPRATAPRRAAPGTSSTRAASIPRPRSPWPTRSSTPTARPSSPNLEAWFGSAPPSPARRSGSRHTGTTSSSPPATTSASPRETSTTPTTRPSRTGSRATSRLRTPTSSATSSSASPTSPAPRTSPSCRGSP